MERSDMELVRDYGRHQSEQAFRTLVERHINVVYAVALRQTGDHETAQDVAQTVFLDLATKASRLPDRTILSGWLYRATRFASANFRRAEARREHWERHASPLEPYSMDSEPDHFSQAAPLLDEALDELPEIDRAAILLRFFEKRSLDEVGRALGTTEAAAKMRLSRAIERLRQLFRRRGLAISTSVVLALLATQSAPAAPAGLAATIATAAIVKNASGATVLATKGTLKFMAQAQAHKFAASTVALLLAASTAVVVQESMPGSVAADAPAPEPPKAAPAATVKPAESKVLVFRNQPSWNRNPDFEDVLSDLGLEFDVKESSEMASADLAPYRFVVIPGAQWRTDFYQTFNANQDRFSRYVTNGGVLVLELNGAENDGVTLPLGVTVAKHGSRDNIILAPQHPAVAPFIGRHIRASYASHGFLQNVPTNAIILAAEALDDMPDLTKPTYVEYPHGSGRVIAACQCFHDQDRSNRGPLMPSLLTYAAGKRWFSAPKK